MKYDYLHLYIQIDCLRHIFPINVEHPRKTIVPPCPIVIPIEAAVAVEFLAVVFVGLRVTASAFAHQTTVGVVVVRFRHTLQI